MPERWLLAPEQGDSGVGIATKESLALAYSAFSPFSIGPRSCVGRVLAYAEMSLVIARVIWQLEMRLEPGWKQIGDGVYPIVDMFVARGHGPMIEFRERTR
jgi:cytochrome P450